MTDQTRISGSGLKVLKVLKALSGHSLTGLSNSELASGLNESPATVNRCLNTLIEAGLAIQLDNKRYAHGVAMLQLAQGHATEISRATNRINELNQRVAAGSF
ncbi:helix-turn-helix domain-containing protein [Rheinheimera maricola]|uniref:Helix-turn-helix domain-containing protein n=1 Tax=Rheinheimera maricola TaxID=2793282 RepID=A0ABS7X5G1_9GAMM|nr:helix-turn-helix domain-containing protein [Rheinheimera maricola]MBZ9610780.1 helix-turn-helix domain-containing protein [Rheinheimera maricola]